MKLVTYRLSGAEHVGALTADGKGVLPLPAADMNTLIETMTLPTFALPPRRAERGRSGPAVRCGAAGSHPRPRQDVVCLGMNYRDHAENPPGTAPMPSPRTVQRRSTSLSGSARPGSPTASSPVTRALRTGWTMRRSWRWCWAKPPGT